MMQIADQAAYEALSQTNRDRLVMKRRLPGGVSGIRRAIAAFERGWLSAHLAGTGLDYLNDVSRLAAIALLPEVYGVEDLTRWPRASLDEIPLSALLRTAFDLRLHNNESIRRGAKIWRTETISPFIDYTPAAPLPHVSCVKLAMRNEYAAVRPLRVVSPEEFKTQWAECTLGILDGILSAHVVCAGGLINKLLTGADIAGADIDIFICGANPEEREFRCRETIEKIDAALTTMFPDRQIYYVPKASVVNIHIAGEALNIQVVVSAFASGCSVLANFDMSHVCCLYDGEQAQVLGVWLEATYTNVSRPVSNRHRVPLRLMKHLWNGYYLEDAEEMRTEWGLTAILEEIEAKSIDSIVDKLSAVLHLGYHNSTNRYMLSLFHSASVEEVPKAACDLLEYDSDFSSYSCVAWSAEKLELLMQSAIITPSAHAKPLAINGKTVVMLCKAIEVTSVSEEGGARRIAYARATPQITAMIEYIDHTAFKTLAGAPPIGSVLQDGLISFGYSVDKTPCFDSRGRKIAAILGDGTFLAKLRFNIYIDPVARTYNLRARNMVV